MEVFEVSSGLNAEVMSQALNIFGLEIVEQREGQNLESKDCSCKGCGSCDTCGYSPSL